MRWFQICLSTWVKNFFSPNEKEQPSLSLLFLNNDMISEILATILGQLGKNMSMRYNKMRIAKWHSER